MKSLTLKTAALLLVAAVTLSVTGCSADARKSRHLSQAKEFFDQGQYDKAEIEYMNVLQLDANNGEAFAGLGLIYFDQSRANRVYACLIKAKELLPNDPRVRSKLAAVLSSAGNTEEAYKEALQALTLKPDDAEAPMLLAQSAPPPQINATRERLRALPPTVQDRAPVIVALGLLDLRQQKPREAEQAFQRGIEVDPKFPGSYFALSVLHRSRQETSRAEQALAKAAELSPIRSSTRLQYAQFARQIGNEDAARATLEEIIAQAPDCFPPYILLAEILERKQDLDGSRALIDKVLARDNTHPEALVQSARLHLAKGMADKAVVDLERAARLYPQVANLHYHLGVAAAMAGDPGRASVALAESVRLDPNSAPAVLALAEVNLRQNNVLGAINVLKAFVQLRPEMAETRLALASAHARQGNVNEALTLYRDLEKSYPKNPQVPLLRGALHVQQNKPADARQAFERALQISPTLIPALEQLIDLDVREKNFAAAHARISAFIAKETTSAAGYSLLAKIQLAQEDHAGAEATLQKVVSLQPNHPLPYMMLAGVYIRSNRQDEAIARLRDAFAKQPRNAEPLMMIAVIYDRQERYAEARDVYEQLLTVNPKFSPALNNLAYIYSEHLNNLDRAFELAQRARELMPTEAHAADTLGWVVHKRGQYTWALSLLTEAIDRLGSSADVNYHLGITHYMLGHEQLARPLLEQALKLDTRFLGHEEARHALEVLNIDPATSGPEEVTRLEQSIARKPDPVAYARLGAIHARRGDLAKASDAFSEALKISPANIAAALGMTRVHRARGETDKAIELAKSTRKIAPTHPEVAQELGELALQTRDYPWAASLLQEVARAKPSDPAAQALYAQAAYQNGQEDVAAETARRAVDLGGASPHTDRARELAELIELSRVDARASAARARIEQILRQDPKSTAALMALAAARRHEGDQAGAIATYRQIVDERPTFAPAVRALAFALAATGKDDPKAAELASRARDAYPGDTQLAKMYGLLLFRTGNFPRATSMLLEASRSLNDDSELLYHLGMSQLQQKDRAGGTRSLRRALELGLTGSWAAEANKALATP